MVSTELNELSILARDEIEVDLMYFIEDVYHHFSSFCPQASIFDDLLIMIPY